MAERFELGFRRTSDGRVSLQLSLIPRDCESYHDDSSDQPLSDYKFRRTSAQIVAFVQRLAIAAEADDGDFDRETKGELEFLQRMSRFMADDEPGDLQDTDQPGCVLAHQDPRPSESLETLTSMAAHKHRRKPSRAATSPSRLPIPVPPLKLSSSTAKAPITQLRSPTTSVGQPERHQFDDSAYDASASSIQTSIRRTRPLTRKPSNSLAFRISEDGYIVPQELEQPTFLRTPTDEIIVPRLRKSHVKPESKVTIEVGGQEFHACSDILEESPWFVKAIRRASFSGGAPRVRIENDPDLFAEVLKYLRTGIFPFYWDKTNGFDYGRYAEMEVQAKMYQLQPLVQWIQDKRYLDVIKVETVMKETKIRQGTEHYQRHILLGNEEQTVDAVLSGVDEIWMCPSSIKSHEGDSTLCELEGCCGDLLKASAKNYPEQRIKVDVVRVFTTQRKWTVNNHLLQARKKSEV